MPQHAAGEGCSGAKGPDEEDSEQDERNSGRSAENYLGASSPDEVESEQDESDSGRSAEDCGGANCSDKEISEREKIATDINQSINQSSLFIHEKYLTRRFACGVVSK